MAYRTVKFAWLPSTCQGWLVFTSVRKGAARLWSWLVKRHATIRQRGGRWPTRNDLQKEIKGLFPGLHPQSAQMILHDFCEAVASAESLRKNGEPFEYPHRKLTFLQVLFSNQAPVSATAAFDLLNYKLAACIEVEEAYSSQTCPVCGERSKHRRTYRCRCGYEAPRDVVGRTKIRTIGIEGAIRPGCCVPNAIRFVHPSKDPGPAPGSPTDTGHVTRPHPPRIPRL